MATPKIYSWQHFLILSILGSGAPASQAQTLAITDLENISVTALRLPRLLEQAPVTIYKIDAEEIENHLIHDIVDLTRYTPGVSVSNNPGRFGPNSFNIRGITSNRILMQVDGIRLPGAFAIGSFSSASRNVIDVDALKSVEFLRGPSSSLYGSDAIGGMVTYLTKDPEDYLQQTDNPVYTSLKAGYDSTDDSWLGTVTLAGEYGGLQGLLLTTCRNGSETSNQGETGGTGSLRTEPNPQSYDDFNFLGKVVYNLNDRHAFKVTAEKLDSDTETDVLTLNPTTPRTSGLTGDDTSERWRVSLAHDYHNNANRWLQGAQWQIYTQESTTEQLSRETRSRTTAGCSGVTIGMNTCLFQRDFNYEQRIIGGSLQMDSLFTFGNWSHQFVYGMDISNTRTDQTRDGLRTNLTTGVSTKAVAPDVFPVRDFPKSDTLLAGGFIQDEIKYGPFSIYPGIRFDYYRLQPDPDDIFTEDNPGIAPVEISENAVSPKVGLLFDITSQLTLFGNYAQGFRAPPFNDVNIGFTNLAFGYTAIPNQDLKAETSQGVEAGLRGTFSSLNFELTGFYNNYEDFIESFFALDCPSDPVCVPGLTTFQSRNLDKVSIYGIEARGDIDLTHGFSLRAALSHTIGENDESGQPLNSVDPFKVVVGLQYSREKWGAELVTTAVEEKYRLDRSGLPNIQPSSGYVILDLLAHWHLTKHVTVNAGIFNLTDKKYFQWSDMQGVGGGTAALPGSLSLERFSQPGINASANVRVEF